MDLRPNRPINIEFTGTPEAGKTTQLFKISNQLRSEGFSVSTVQESAEIVPNCFKKTSADANRWMTLNTIAELLCANATNVDIIIIDRGLIDKLIWHQILFEQKQISYTEVETYPLYFNEFGLEPDLLCAFFTSPEVSIKRRGGEGRITTKSFVKMYNEISAKFCESYSGNVLKINANQSMNTVSQILLDNIHSLLS